MHLIRSARAGWDWEKPYRNYGKLDPLDRREPHYGVGGFLRARLEILLAGGRMRMLAGIAHFAADGRIGRDGYRGKGVEP